MTRTRDKPESKTRAAALFLLVSTLCGLLVAAAALPAVGAAWAGTRSAQDSIDDLPVAFDTPAQSQRSRVLDANGDVLAYFYEENRVYVELDDIAPAMRRAIVAIEDHRFYEHGPLDLQGTLRALLSNAVAGDVTQGGSSITQQYVKMVQIEEAKKRGDEAGIEAAQDDTYGRKIRELRYATSVEKALSKDEILERYLNIAYFGDGAYGVEAAAEHYFGTTASKLTLPQAALLAGLVRNPTALSPTANEAAALDRRDVVLNRMTEVGAIASEQARKAKRATFDEDEVRATANGCEPSDYPFLCDYAYRSLMQMPSLGGTDEERENTIKRGGLTVRTAIDPGTQDAVQEAVNDVVAPTDPVIAAMNMVEPGTGRIVAMAQSRPEMGRDDGETYWNYSVGPEMGGAQGFQAGSTFKAFTAAAALAEDIPLSQRYDARARMNFSNARFDTCQGPSRVFGDWQVRNSTGTNGPMNMYRATEQSVNTYYVQLALDVGMCDVVTMAEKLGVQSSTPDAPISSYDDKPSFTLGSVEVSPMSMAEAYATFASGGIHCDPVLLDSVTDSSGTEHEVPSANCERVISEDVANAMNTLLVSVPRNGTGRRAVTADGRPQAGKTGTIDSNEAVWFVGYTPQVSGAAMISIDNRQAPFNTANPRNGNGLKNYVVPSTGLPLEGTGSGDAGQDIWRPAMTEYLADLPAEDFEPGPASLVSRQAPTERGLADQAFPRRFGAGR